MVQGLVTHKAPAETADRHSQLQAIPASGGFLPGAAEHRPSLVILLSEPPLCRGRDPRSYRVPAVNVSNFACPFHNSLMQRVIPQSFVYLFSDLGRSIVGLDQDSRPALRHEFRHGEGSAGEAWDAGRLRLEQGDAVGLETTRHHKQVVFGV